MKITFLGTGTSGGIPELLCACPVCRSKDPKNQRMRTSAYVQAGKTSILIDTSPDFRQQILRFGVKQIDAILYTHNHYDHISGLDEIRNFNWEFNTSIPVYGSAATINYFRKRFDYFFNPQQIGGGVPQIKLNTVNRPFTIGTNRVEPLPVLHGKLPILGYKIGGLVYITDASYIPPAIINKIHGVDLLVLNALRYQPHDTHFNLEAALAIIRRVKPRRAALVHFTHDVDHETLCRQLPKTVIPAYDGLRLTVI